MASKNDTASKDDGCPSDSTLPLLSAITFWGEGVTVLAISVVGLVCNAAAAPVLCSRKMASTFNRLLLFLTVFDSIFLVCCMAESVRKHFYKEPSDAYTYAFVYGLYQMQNIALMCSIYTTLALAVERYLSVARPLQYHLSIVGPWARAWRYAAPTFTFSVAFNLPKFFELKVVEEVVGVSDVDGSNLTRASMEVRDLRFDEDYVFYYVNWARLFVTGIVPFFGLAFLNTGIHM